MGLKMIRAEATRAVVLFQNFLHNRKTISTLMLPKRAVISLCMEKSVLPVTLKKILVRDVCIGPQKYFK